eukprot:TRINITY_DN113115_c0_g1_i1.p1 TRINITY_DN113115_c0_g1~~TRINITY_DN113115_c0_g1_i1.p1  ORF type:complete len:366 (+),score=25.90 TRINITY_DN113115_c0_g1_i1:99-1196(+)
MPRRALLYSCGFQRHRNGRWIESNRCGFWQLLWLLTCSVAHAHPGAGHGGGHRKLASVAVSPTSEIEMQADAAVGSREDDCSWETWGSWSACSASCGSGLKARYRGRVGPFGNGTECIGINRENVNCNMQLCPRDCVVDVWGDWGACTVTCGGPRHPGQMMRSRGRKTKAAYGGKECEEPLTDSRPCLDHPSDNCPSDCVWAEWSSFSACTLTCGTYGGIKVRERQIGKQAEQGGRECTGNPYETKVCNRKVCIQDCEWYSWQEWVSCSVTCGKGVKLRVRDMSRMQNDLGSCPGTGVDSAPCQLEECPRDCKYMEWGEWSPCTVVCGGGERKKKRSRIPETQGGKPCTEESEWTEPCNMAQCTE